jgi:hypothetical protein
MKSRHWRSQATAEHMNAEIAAENHYLIISDDIKDLPRSDWLVLKGIIPQPGFSFVVRTHDGNQQYSNSLRTAIWAYEIWQLILHKPSHLKQMLGLGNYEALKTLTGEFYFFSNPFEYFVRLGRWLAWFHRNGGFEQTLMILAISVFDNMTGLAFQDATNVAGASITGGGMIERSVGLLPNDTLQILQAAQKLDKCLSYFKAGAVELFDELPPVLNLPLLGLINRVQMEIKLPEQESVDAFKASSDSASHNTVEVIPAHHAFQHALSNNNIGSNAMPTKETTSLKETLAKKETKKEAFTNSPHPTALAARSTHVPVQETSVAGLNPNNLIGKWIDGQFYYENKIMRRINTNADLEQIGSMFETTPATHIVIPDYEESIPIVSRFSRYSR